jgi:hypothetical protein
MVATLQSGPFNIEQGNTANFVIEFLDANKNYTVPANPSLQVAYTNTSFSSQTDTVTLTNIGGFFNGSWSSTSAVLGIATWTATTPTTSVIVRIGQLRVIQRRGS